jgi:hypothetical protein
MNTYFKKYDPHVPLNTSMGQRIPFREVGGSWGVLFTQDNYVIGELRRAIQEQRGGVMEITESEYAELLKKKTTNFSRVYRETVGQTALRRMCIRVGHAAAAEGRMSPLAKEQIQASKVLLRPQGKSDLVVKGVSR